MTTPQRSTSSVEHEGSETSAVDTLGSTPTRPRTTHTIVQVQCNQIGCCEYGYTTTAHQHPDGQTYCYACGHPTIIIPWEDELLPDKEPF